MSHSFYHQNVPALMCMFHLPCDQARAIVATCPNCQQHQVPSLGYGVKPQGLNSCQLWQTDVIHYLAGKNTYTCPLTCFQEQRLLRLTQERKPKMSPGTFSWCLPPWASQNKLKLPIALPTPPTNSGISSISGG